MIESAVVAVRGMHGLAAGCLVDDLHVITCAHVLDPELGRLQPTTKPMISFPLISPDTLLETAIVLWEPDSKIDLAVLRLESGPPAGVQPAPIDEVAAGKEDLWGRQVRFFGFPQATGDSGIWSEGELKGRQAQGWLQLEDERARGYFIEPGFSGTPLWDAHAKVVRGMVLARDRQGSLRVGYAVPTSVILSAAAMLYPRPAVGVAPTGTPRITQHSLARHLLDHLFPRAHRWLTHWGLFADAGERSDIYEYLRRVHRQMDESTAHYLPLSGRSLHAKQAQLNMLERQWPHREATRVMRQRIRLIVSGMLGEDAGSAQIALINRRSKLVRNLHKMLLRSKSSLVLLGDPGTGKSMTLRQVAKKMAELEQLRVFPRVPIFVRLGNLQLPPQPLPVHVLDHALAQLPASLRQYSNDLLARGRLAVLFDGMDEMNRARYVEYVRVLSAFATEYGDRVKTLFSCRINDFSPEFRHEQLVVMPFSNSQIELYLRSALDFPALISEKQYGARELTEDLIRGDVPIEPSNPMNLFLLADYMLREQKFPTNRAVLFESYVQDAFSKRGTPTLQNPPEQHEVFRIWARIAFEITRRNEGALVDMPVVDEIILEESRDVATATPQSNLLASSLDCGLRCGVLVEELRQDGVSLRFAHHRLQEYFTARHLKSSRDSIDWNSALDIPRWQETVVNLVAMGDGESAVRSLAGLMQAQLESMRLDGFGNREIWPLHDSSGEPAGGDLLRTRAQLERLLSERVELAARILGDGRRELIGVAAILRPALVEAAGELMKGGNPSSQVRMLWAGRTLATDHFAKFVNDLLVSPLVWVRTQALVVASDDESLTRTVGSDIPFEIARDVGAAQFTGRIATYSSVIRRRFRFKNVWAFSAALVTQVVYVLLLAGTAIGGALLALSLSRGAETSLADLSGWSGLFYLCPPVIAAGAGAIRDWRFLPYWVAGGAAISCVWADLTAVVANIDGFLETIFRGLFAICVGLVSAPILAAAICGTTFILFILLTAPVLHWGQASKAFTLMLRARKVTELAPAVLIPGMFGLFMGGFVAIEKVSAIQSSIEFAGRSWDPDWVAGGIMIAMIAGFAGPALILSLGEQIRKQGGVRSLAMSAWQGGLRSLAVYAFRRFPHWLLIGALYVLLFGVVAFLFDSFAGFAERIGLTKYAVQGIYWIVGLILLGIAGYFLMQLALRAYKLMNLRRSRARISIGNWREEFLSADGIAQVELLSDADAQRFGITSEELLNVLVELEAAVKNGAASNKYWSIRYQLEQAARQERVA